MRPRCGSGHRGPGGLDSAAGIRNAGQVMEQSIDVLFRRYETFFRQALQNEADMDEVTSSCAEALVTASPAGVKAGSNGTQYKQLMCEGFEPYRRIGTRDVRLRELRVDRIGAHHSIAHVTRTASYVRAGRRTCTSISISTTWYSISAGRPRSSAG